MMKAHKLESLPTITGFPTWPAFDDDDIAAVSAILRSGKVNRWTGQENVLFEQEFAAFAGCDYAIALANGTVALELALLVSGVGAGDEVIVTSRSFIASASAIVMRGATPVFADVDPASQNITAATIEPHISPRTKAIITVHLAGWPCEMDDIIQLAGQYNLKVVEDCAQAHGALYKGRPVGSLGHVAAFSFCQDKIMTTGGEGGMLTTNDSELWRRAWSFKDHGKDYDATRRSKSGYSFKFIHDSFGTNGRMTEMQAALGRTGLKKLPEWVRSRQRNAAFLTSNLKNVDGLRITVPPRHISHAYYKYYMFLCPDLLLPDRGRDWILSIINGGGIPCYSGSCSEIYLENAFLQANLSPAKRLTNAQKLGETSLMLLVHPTLSMEHLETTCDIVKKVLKRAAKKTHCKKK